jgi:predicted RNA binding protein YcfA (HicA-like mRNA interferase family)
LTRLYRVHARVVIRFLEFLGFAQVRQKGSQKFFRHTDGRTATVPNHRGEGLARGILAKILREAENSPEEFWDWLSR